MEKGCLDIKLSWKQRGEGANDGQILIGKVISKTRIGLGTVREAVTAAWKVQGGLDVKMINFNMFRFEFKVTKDANRVLKDNPWVVRNYMLSLQKRRPFLSDNEVQINTCEFWVQFHNLPWEGRMESNIRLMANLVGKVIEVENPEDKRFRHRSFGRARVEVDNDNAMVPRFLAPRPDDELDNVWIQVKYEKLLRFCFNCGKLRHESKSCEEEAVEFMVNGVLRGYDASLCTPPMRGSAGNQLDQKISLPPEERKVRENSNIEIGGRGSLGLWNAEERGEASTGPRGKLTREDMSKPQELIVAEMDGRREISLGRCGVQRKIHHVCKGNKVESEGLVFGQLGQKFGGPNMEGEENIGLNNVLKA